MARPAQRLAFSAVLVVLGVGSCFLNPQPEPPRLRNTSVRPAETAEHPEPQAEVAMAAQARSLMAPPA